MSNIRKLLEEFDEAARDWGWEQDQGYGKSVHESRTRYNIFRQKLLNEIENLLEYKWKYEQLTE